MYARRGIAGAAVIGAICAVAGWRVAEELAAKNIAVPAAFVGYLVLLAGAWWATKGHAPSVVLLAYLLGPPPADNLLPQVTIFPSSDFAVRSYDLFLFADLVLVAALLWVRPAWPTQRVVRWWLVGLIVLAAYPAVLGLWLGEGQSVTALAQGMAMPLRGVGLVWLVSGWAARHGWHATVRNLVRVVVVSGAVLAAGVLFAVLVAGGQTQLSVLGYPLIVDGRPALPGWGNNILANFLCVCVAIAVFCRAHLQWRIRWVAGVVLLFVVGIVFTEVRIAAVLALVIAEAPLVIALVKWLWPSQANHRRRAVAVTVGALGAVVLIVATVTALPVLNPRFTTLTPAVITQQLPDAAPDADPDRPTFDEATGMDLGGESAATRTKLVKAAGMLWLHHPGYGIGWNGWGWGKSELPVMEPEPLVPLVVAIDPHNGFLWLLAEAGLLGVVLLYGAPLVSAIRSGRSVWWLWAPVVVAMSLEMVNSNLRNGHFAAVVWALAALAMVHRSHHTLEERRALDG